MQKIVGNSVLDQYFPDGIMSLHIKERVPVARKGGKPGEWAVTIDQNLIFSKEETYALIDKICAEIETRYDASLEIDKQYFKIIQLGPYRTVIVYPPLSDGLELTIVKPVKLLTIEDYGLEENVMTLLKEQAK